MLVMFLMSLLPVEAEDLYDDLYEDDTLFYKAPFQEIDIREEEFKKKEAELNSKVESLLKEVEALQQDKVVLTRNISCLFKTAQMELARKDKQMKELRDENSKLKLGGRRNPGPHSTNAAAKSNSAIVDSAHQPEIERTNAAVDDDSKQRSSSRPENSSSTRAHERDSVGHRKIVDDDRKDASRDRSADDSSNNHRSSSHNSDRRHAEYGRSEHRSRDHSEHRSRDGELRSTDSRKRHRS